VNENITQYEELFGKTLPIDYDTQADRWISFIDKVIRQKIPEINGYGISMGSPTDEFGYWHWQLRFNKQVGNMAVTADVPRLLILPTSTKPKSIYVVLGDTKPISNEDKEMWLKVIKKANQQLKRQQTKTFKWEAAIGQQNEPGGNQYVSLRSRTKVGHITVRPGRNSFSFAGSTPMPTFNSGSFSTTYPIIVSGAAVGYDWLEASKQASRDLNKFAELLSIAWKSTWKVIHSPQLIGASPLKIPNRSLGMPIRALRLPRTRKSIPKWLIKAFKKVDKNVALSNALKTHHEGLLMQSDHPSFANLAFVSAIETIGRKLAGSRVGNKERFRIGLRTVYSAKKVKIIEASYSPRSSTTHEAVLHGNESMAGHVGLPSIFNPDPADIFGISEVLKIKTVSSKVLEKQLRLL